jgi:hypothetical protein
MSRLVWTVAGHRAGQRSGERAIPNRMGVALFSGGAIVVLAFGLSSVQPVPLWAGDEPSAGPEPRAAASPSRFVAESRETLKRLHEKLASMGGQVLDGLDINEPTEADMAIQGLMVESAKAGNDHALLVCEAAEIALDEYREALSEQEKKSGETEIKLAQVELESAERAIPQARERYAKIKQVRTGSAGDLARGWQIESGEVIAQLLVRKARFALEQAQSKLSPLSDLRMGIREKHLMSRFEKARSDELARRASWGREQSKLLKLNRMQDPARSRFLFTDQRKRNLALLDRAIPIEEQLSARLDQIKPDSQPGDSLRKEITDLTRQLQEIVDTAQGAATAAALGRLKARLDRASAR